MLAEFERVSDAVTAALAFQSGQAEHNAQIEDDIRPTVRVGIAMGEVVFADRTVTGAGVVLAQRMEQLAEPGGICITGAIQEALPQRMPFERESLGEHEVKGFDRPVQIYSVQLKEGVALPEPGATPGATSVSTSWRALAVAASIALGAGGLLAWYQPWSPRFEPVSPEAMAHPLPDKPSIAVLPFDNMSDDPDQDYFVDGMTHAGQPDEAIAAVKRAMRLDPHYPPYYLFVLGLANFTAGQLEEAIVNFERALERNPEHIFPTLQLAAAYAHLGREQEARAALGKFRKVFSDPSLEVLAPYWPFKRQVDANRFLDGLRKAGVPE